ncbi:MAG: flagellar hook capping FlgD N-terminal domain-containing protein [Endozoicomonas sp. (ex Botrylloides leachii)]|nr:flagellar hook capping FlgD N-terminal domain-containing protein [Endozoicomonas sp. (ex Botrylloides leachii)]
MTAIAQVDNLTTRTNQNNSTVLQPTQNQFMELFIAQLRAQDPTAPLDTNQMLSQLSQISSVESLTSIDTRIDGLTSALEQSQLLGAVQLVGHEIEVATNKMSIQSESAIKGKVTLPINSDDILLRVYNSNGSIISSKSLGAKSSGTHSFELDALAAGNYTITATGISGNEAYAGDVSLLAKVTNVEAGINGANVKLGELGSYPLGLVSRVGGKNFN